MKLLPPPGPRRWISLAVLLAAAGYGGKSLRDEVRHIVEIDAGNTRAPISKYLYGQLLEHAGRSIYGGVWAEMLEDGKFLFPVDGKGPGWEMVQPPRGYFDGAGVPYEVLKRSPWQIVGPADAVGMDTTSPYVGEHAVRVTLPPGGAQAGIAYARLGLVAGRRYEARVVAAGDPTASPIEVSLAWGSGRTVLSLPDIGPDYRAYALRFTAGASTADGRFEITGRGTGVFRIGEASLMPEGNVAGLRADTLALLKELAPTIIRWPGGDFASGYDFRDGLGPRDRRVPRANPAWHGVESNDFGMHEFMDLCARLDAEPYVVVNTGSAGEGLAAQEVEYANGATTTPMGKLRADNGHPDPWRVRWWGVGNEMWAGWQIGHMPVERYAAKHNRIVDAMRRVDPALQFVASGEIGEWDEHMLANAADHMDLISAHVYVPDRDDVPGHVTRLSEELSRYLDEHRRYRREVPALRGKHVGVAVDEWAYWYGAYRYGVLGVRHHLKDALGVAVTLHTLFANADLVGMANWAQAVNALGCIKTSATDAVFSAACLPLVLYRHHFGEIPVALGHIPREVHVAAAWTLDRRALTVAVVNPQASAQSLRFDVSGADLRGDGTVYRVAGDDPMWFNEPGARPRLGIVERTERDLTGALEVPPFSVSLYVLPVR